MSSTEKNPSTATSASALPPPPVAAAATVTESDIENPSSDDHAPFPPAKLAAKTAMDDDGMTDAVNESIAVAQSLGIDPLISPTQIANRYKNDVAPQMATTTMPPLGRGPALQGEPPLSGPSTIRPFHGVTTPGAVRVAGPGGPASSIPMRSRLDEGDAPSNPVLPPLSEPSVPMLEATIAPDVPVYDGVEVTEVEKSWLKRKEKYIFWALALLFGGAVATGVSLRSNININEGFVASGSPPLSGSPTYSSNPSQSSSPSQDPSSRPTHQPSFRPSSWPSLSPSSSESPSSSPRPSPLPSSPPSTCWSSLKWNQQGQDINGEETDENIGTAVALSDDGTIMAIGAPWYYGLGHVKVFRREGEGSSWEQRGDILYGKGNNDEFGYSLSISGDGNILSIGAPYNDENGNDSGQVEIFKWDEAALNYKQRCDALRGEQADNWFGFSLDLSSDGEILAVGAPVNSSNGVYSGQVKIYAWDSVLSNYKQQGHAMDGSAAEMRFGSSVSLSGDGTKLAVGAHWDGTKEEVRVFAWDEATMNYEQLGGAINSEADYDAFGSSVSLSDDGTTLAVGAPYNGENDSGQVKVFKWDPASANFKQHGRSLYGIRRGSLFGNYVILSSDGNTLAIGAPQRSRQGYVEVFRWDDGTSVYKQLGQTLDGDEDHDGFGFTVGLSADGKTLAAGVPFKNLNGYNLGQAKVFNIEF